MADIVTKIRQGTRSDSTDLCKSCSNCAIRFDTADNEERRFCSTFETKLTSRVAECSNYYNSNLPSLKTLYDTAWILSTDKVTRDIGFIRFDKWKQKSGNDTPDEYYE